MRARIYSYSGDFSEEVNKEVLTKLVKFMKAARLIESYQENRYYPGGFYLEFDEDNCKEVLAISAAGFTVTLLEEDES